MKILFYINSLGRGGAERVMCNLATAFSEHNHESIIVTSFLVDKEYSIGNKVKRISLFREKLSCGFLARNFRLTSELRKHIRIEQPDVVVAFMAEPNYRAIIASLGLKNKVIISVRNDPNIEYPNAINQLLAKFLYRIADGVVFQTEDAKKWFPAVVQKKSKIIFNQVDEVFYNIKFNGERHDIVTIGRLTAQKNHKMLIHAFASVANKIADNLIIYGEGELRGELESLINELHMENRIFLPGIINNVAETIVSAKLFILSSDYEGMPNSLMEAMALRIPCISTDCPCGGPRMLFGDLLSDRLFPCGDQKKLSELIEKMLINKVDGNMEKLLSEQFKPSLILGKWVEYVDKINEHK